MAFWIAMIAGGVLFISAAWSAQITVFSQDAKIGDAVTAMAFIGVCLVLAAGIRARR